MSRPRYDWWPYVKGMVRRYPALLAEHRSLRSQVVTTDYEAGINPLGGVSRPVEDCLWKGLGGIALRELEAVEAAISATERMDGGRERLLVVELVLWKGFTLDTASLRVPCSIATAKRWHGAFLRLVALEFGLLDGEHDAG